MVGYVDMFLKVNLDIFRLPTYLFLEYILDQPLLC